MELKAGTRLRSTVGTAEVIVVRAPASAVELTSGGASMVPTDDPSPTVVPADGHEGETQIGKRYVDEESNIEVLCTKAGAGVLAVDGRPLTIKGAKPLPSSD
jgi:hypothetical protein